MLDTSLKLRAELKTFLDDLVFIPLNLCTNFSEKLVFRQEKISQPSDTRVSGLKK